MPRRTDFADDRDAGGRAISRAHSRVRRARRRLSCLAAAAALLFVGIGIARAQATMPDPKEISGVPLQTSDLPAGTVSVRVIRGSFANNLPGVPVTFVVDGKSTVVKTGEDGRAQLPNLPPGAHVTASADVGAEHLVSQDIVIANSGVRLVLTATDSSAAAGQGGDQALAHGPAVPGTVTFGPDSRIVVDFSQDQLNIYYVVEVVNAARTPVDIGGPITFDLPTGAQGPTLLQESSKQAVIKDGQVIVTGPFAPGTTDVDLAFVWPYSGGTAHIEQRWPIALQTLSVIALRTGAIDLSSPQIESKRFVTDQGQAVVATETGAIAAGQTFAFDVTGLPHHPLWPRYTALALAGVIVAIGLWAAVAVPRTERAAA